MVESLDDTILGIKHVAKAKKRNAIEIMFDYHSLLMSFELDTTMTRWVEELRRIASKSVKVYTQCNVIIITKILVKNF